MSNPATRPGPDSTLAEVREQLIEAGMELLRQRGVDVGLSRISLSDTIAASGTSRSTAYRSLTDDELAPQAVLHRDIMAALLNRDSRRERMTVIVEAVEAEVERQSDALTSADVADRTAAIRGIIRVGANASYATITTSQERAVLIAMFGALRSAPEPDWRHEAIKQGEHNLTQAFATLYRTMLEQFQYRCKPPFTFEQLAVAAAAQVEGLAMRSGLNPFLESVFRPERPGGAEAEWSLFSVAFEALVIAMCEPNNPEDPFADLSRY